MSNRQHILVTGATSGLGREIARQLAAKGNVHIHGVGRRAARLSELEAELSAKGAKFTGHAIDLTDDPAVRQALSTVERLDGLILNAGVTFADPFLAGDLGTDQAIIDTNISANLRLVRGLIPQLKSSQGKILLVASLGGLVPVPYQSVYAGSKAFMVNFGLSLREELKAENIQVSVFAPGGIATEMTDGESFSHLESKLAPPEKVAAQALKAYARMPAISIPGAENRFVALLGRLLPRGFMARQAAKIYRPDR